MKKIIFCFLVGFLTLNLQCIYAQYDFQKHQVRHGEDVFSIAKKYKINPDHIYALNPMARFGVKQGSYLVLPSKQQNTRKSVKEIVFRNHKTRSKQTLYSIARKYKVSVSEIKEHNTFLEDQPLRKGDILQIPLNENHPPLTFFQKLSGMSDRKVKVVEEREYTGPITQAYTIQAKDTRYGVARRFGLTLQELEQLNPNLKPDEFPIGYQLLVSNPQEQVDHTPVDTSKYQLYKVMPKETLYSLSKRYDISVQKISELNPMIASTGLKAGMILKLPKEQTVSLLEENNFETSTDTQILDLRQYLINRTPKNIAVFLPFEINKTPKDSIYGNNDYKKHLKNSKVRRLTVDFYTGVLTALKKAEQMGIYANVEVFDTENNTAKSIELLENATPKKFDAIIGPLYEKNVASVARVANRYGVPLFSPISNKVASNYKVLYQTIPSSKMLEERMIDFVKKDSMTPRKIVVISDKPSYAIRTRLRGHFPDAEYLTPEQENFVSQDEINAIFDPEVPSDLPHHVFLESKNMTFVSNVIPFLNARSKSHNITLFTTNKTKPFDNESVQHIHLSQLNFHYPSVNEEYLDNDIDQNNFSNLYRVHFNNEPNQYAARGYDLTLDVLLRLSASTDKLKISEQTFTTEYPRNRFQYVLTPQGGYQNMASYILKYNPEMKVVVVE